MSIAACYPTTTTHGSVVSGWHKYGTSGTIQIPTNCRNLPLQIGELSNPITMDIVLPWISIVGVIGGIMIVITNIQAYASFVADFILECCLDKSPDKTE